MLNEHAALLFSESVISQPHIYFVREEKVENNFDFLTFRC